MTRDQRTTRLAPSPTGALHLGNARTFLANWAMARRHGWRIVLRIEDLDGPRVKPGADTQAIEDLRWLGLDWDEGPYYQRSDLAAYHQALDTLRRRNLIYACSCTRKELETAQSAPHAGEHEVRYPGTCRGRGLGGTSIDATPMLAWRVIVPDEDVVFSDELTGTHRENIQRAVGDFVIATKAGLPAYQLAVVVDDARQGVTEVVRGDDLLSSTGRQIWLYRMLELAPLPRYWHLPLVLGDDGRRLAKRHGDSRIATYRARGVAPERIIGLLAAWCGMTKYPEPMNARDFAAAFDLGVLPRNSVVFHPENHAWLLDGAS